MTMNPYLSWAILLVVAGGLGWYYTNGAAPKAKAPIQTPVEKAQVVPKKPKRKTKTPESAPAKSSEVKTVVSPPTTEDEKPEEDIDPREMARRQAAMKNGLPQTAASTVKGKKKKQQKKAAQLEVGSHASSTTGAEADDDLSPAVSPQVNATVPSAGDVDDMVETPAAGATAKVLRVTGEAPSQPQKKMKNEPEPDKSKKARSHQRKNEERKEQARLDEADRRKMLEQHRRNIPEREATWSKSHAANAWENKAAANGASKPAPAPAASNVQLLDTFTPASSATNEWEQGLPTEEVQEQMAKAADADQAWTQVKTKKGGNKKGGKTDESVSETSASEAKSAPVTSAPAPAPVKPRVTITPTYLPDLRSREKGHPMDSDWAA